MTLAVSLRVPDGIVVAADSLSTAQSSVQIATQTQVKCPECGKVIGDKLKLPSVVFPFSASSYTQKLFCLEERFAVASIGQGVINGRSTYYHLKSLEEQLQGQPATLQQVRDQLIQYMEAQLLQENPKYREEAPENWRPVGFHINGYETNEDGEHEAVTYEVYLGRQNIIRRLDAIGCTVGGDTKVVQKLWEIGKKDPRLSFNYHLFSLQDAIDHCTFLIETTSKYQRFGNQVQTVGGEVDVALVTPFRGFQWIQLKALRRTLEGAQ